jgi:hypothetical protein
MPWHLYTRCSWEGAFFAQSAVDSQALCLTAALSNSPCSPLRRNLQLQGQEKHADTHNGGHGVCCGASGGDQHRHRGCCGHIGCHCQNITVARDTSFATLSYDDMEKRMENFHDLQLEYCLAQCDRAPSHISARSLVGERTWHRRIIDGPVAKRLVPAETNDSIELAFVRHPPSYKPGPQQLMQWCRHSLISLWTRRFLTTF